MGVGTASRANPAPVLVSGRDGSAGLLDKATEVEGKGDVSVRWTAFLEGAEPHNGAVGVKVATAEVCAMTSPYPRSCCSRAWWLLWTTWMQQPEVLAEWRHHARTAFPKRWSVQRMLQCRC